MIKKSILLSVLFLLVLVSGVSAQDQPQIVLPAAAFVAYECQFVRETNSVIIQSVVVGSNGATLPRETYRINVATESGEILPASVVNAQRVAQRPPLQMIIVMDITDTVPITEIVDAVTSELIPGLQPADQVALITFSAEISPRTQFYTDKNRLVNEHMLDMLTLEGDNRLFDAIFNAVNDFPLDSDRRQIVLVLTDSNRRNTEQTALRDIIERAQRTNIQNYIIGFYTRDRPDAAELRTLANATGGYAWFYEEIINSRATIGAAVRTNLEEFVNILNNEVTIEVSAQGLQPDASGFVRLNLTLDSDSENPVTDSINCPIERLTHSITFTDDVQEMMVLESVDLGVNVQSDLNPDVLRIVFRVNDEIAQDSISQVFRFNAAGNKPGYYAIGAQLIDNTGTVLATTPTTVRVYVRQSIQLNVLGQPDFNNLTGEVQLEAVARPDMDLRAVRFDIAPVEGGGQSVPLTDTLVAFDPSGRAVLSVPNINERVGLLFPDQPEAARYLLTAVVPGATFDAPALALSNSVEVGVVPPPPPPVAVVAVRVPSATVPNALLVGLIALNILLIFAVRRAGVLRMIRTPDRHDLSPQLMSITVRRDGVKQQHVLTKKTVTIGRGSSNDINLGDDPNISRQHAVIMWRKRQWYFANRKSRAESRINGRRFVGFKRYKLHPITEIEVGGALLVFHSNAQQDISEFIKTNL